MIMKTKYEISPQNGQPLVILISKSNHYTPVQVLGSLVSSPTTVARARLLVTVS